MLASGSQSFFFSSPGSSLGPDSGFVLRVIGQIVTCGLFVLKDPKVES